MRQLEIYLVNGKCIVIPTECDDVEKVYQLFTSNEWVQEEGLYIRTRDITSFQIIEVDR